MASGYTADDYAGEFLSVMALDGNVGICDSVTYRQLVAAIAAIMGRDNERGDHGVSHGRDPGCADEV